jgi:putative alpha-1,2-mannosidase
MKSPTNVYVKRVSVNGKTIEGTQLSHNDIINGGDIIFEMTDKPN